MLKAARQNPHLIAQVVLTTSQLHMDRTVKRLIAEGYVGDVLAIEANMNVTRGFIDRDAPFDWRLDADLTGFNRFPLGLAYEAVKRWVGEAKCVMAMGTTFVKTRHDPQSGLRRAIRMPDHLDVVAEMVCGAQAHLGLSTVSGLAPAGFAITIFGSEGTLRITLSELFGGQRGDEALAEITIAPEEEGGWRFEDEFVNAIRGKGVITHTTFDVGVKYMEFTEAVARSLAEGRAISLPL